MKTIAGWGPAVVGVIRLALRATPSAAGRLKNVSGVVVEAAADGEAGMRTTRAAIRTAAIRARKGGSGMGALATSGPGRGRPVRCASRCGATAAKLPNGKSKGIYL